MRITTGMLHADSRRNLAANVEALGRVQDRVSSGRQLNRPSDDPANVRQAVKLRDAIAELEQHRRNIETAGRTLDAADAALSRVGEVMQRARELAVQGANSALSAADRSAIAQEVVQLQESMVQMAGTRVGESYVFSGFRSDLPPFAGPTSAYQGDSGAVMARIAPGTSVRTNLPGDIVFGNSLAALEQLRVDLVGGAPVAGTTIILLDAGMNEVLDSRAILGSRQNRIAMTMVSLDDNVFASRKLLSDLEDVDLTVAISELTLRQTTYEAALQVSARILQTSLINQLR